jgi:glutamine synthetase
VFKNFEEAKKYVAEYNINIIDLKYCDLWGQWHHITVPASQFTPQLMEEGIGFDGSSVGLKNVKAGDMVLIPDLTTGFLDPFWEDMTLSFICIALSADSFQAFSNDPRNIAIHAEATLRDIGIATESRWGPEFEFYIFDKVSIRNDPNNSGFYFESIEAGWSKEESDDGLNILQHAGYHIAPPKDRYFNLRQAMVDNLMSMGIPIKYHHHEVGHAGQMEIEVPMMGLVSAGDTILLVKYGTKMTAKENQKAVTYMPKPIFGEAGNGMHFHQHIFNQKENLFYDPDGYGNMSEIARNYIAGLLYHGAAVLGFTNPSTNSYRRLVPGYEAPVNAFYSLGNRSAAIRIPKYAKQAQTARFEFRPPDATCNPYLALAAQLMAGIDGIQKKMDPAELGFGPVDADVFSWSDEQRAVIKPLPTSLDESLKALEDDHDFLCQNGVFSEELIEIWIEHKRDEECDPVRHRPHPYEMQLYFDI